VELKRVSTTPHASRKYLQTNLDYGSPIFQRLIALCFLGEVSIYLPDITVSEIEAHIRKEVVAARQHIRRARKEKSVQLMRNSGNEALDIVFNGLDVNTVSEVLINQFREFLEGAKVTVVPVEGVSIKEVFGKYFSEQPPFKEGNKKHEFPDAFAVEAIRQWSKKNNEKIYVISGDKGVRDACGEGLLTPLEKLEEFLDMVSRRLELSTFAYTQYDYQKVEIKERLKEEVEESGIWVYDPVGEVVGSQVESVSLGRKFLIDVVRERAIFEVEAEVEYSAEVEYIEFGLSGRFAPITHTVHRTRYIQAEVGLELYLDEEGSAVEYVAFVDAPLFPFIDSNPEEPLEE
jgi:hypothetical protein